MNPESGHLVDYEKFKGLFDLNDYELLPPELGRAAKIKLAGNSEAMVSLTSGGKLSKWASKRRKARRRMERESRRKNRGR